MQSRILYLAVLPVYRQHCIDELAKATGSDLLIFAGDRHLDPTVTTGVQSPIVFPVRNRAIFARRALLQTGHWRVAIAASVCIIDLNPRSITAWLLAVVRRALGRRTLAWGHLHPRAGAHSRSSGLRLALRRIVNGTVLYGFDSVKDARLQIPDQPVWVAPNALYPAAELVPTAETKDCILYVGRLEANKNVDLLLDAYIISGLPEAGVRLEVVGSGALEESIIRGAMRHGLQYAVTLHGRVDDVATLRQLYSRAFFSVSPGYVGLSLTQSLGFGVPMLIPADAPHAPEIELARFGGVFQFSGTTSAQTLGAALRETFHHLQDNPVDPEDISASVRARYSAESMARGLLMALDGKQEDYGVDGWGADSSDGR